MSRASVTAWRLVSGMVLLALLAACGGETTPGPAPPGTGTPAPAPPTGSATLPAGQVPAFVNRTAQSGIAHSFGFGAGVNDMVAQFAGGVASGDVNGDGLLDLVVLRGDSGPNLLYMGRGGGVFEDRAAASGIAYTLGATANGRHSGPTLGDLDGDGDLDLVMGGLEDGPMRLYRNDGAGNFANVTGGSGLDQARSRNTISIALGDYDGDGDLDAAMAHWGTPRDPILPGETETLWRNDSTASAIRFTPVSVTSGVAALLVLDSPQGALGPHFDYSFAPSFVDIDSDGDQDLLMVSDFRGSRIMLNNGNGTFARHPFTPDDENGMGAAVGDYDNDGDFDWFVSSINGNRLFQNRAAAGFRRASESGVEPGGWGWGSCFADFNADGWLDIYQTNGWGAGPPYADDTSRLWMSKGNGTFADSASAAGMLEMDHGRGIACDDFDNDGDVDVLLLTAEPQASAFYWENRLAGSNWLKVRLRGKAPNTFAIGARIQLTIADTRQSRMVAVNSNFSSHNSVDQTFGLGSHQTASLRVIWPDGAETILGSVSGNQTLTIDHPAR